jgi:hypothetical protein
MARRGMPVPACLITGQQGRFIMTIHWLQSRTARACVNRIARDKVKAVTPCIASAMAYLHHALTQDDGHQTDAVRKVDHVAHLGALSAALALRKPARGAASPLRGHGVAEEDDNNVHPQADGTLGR